MREIEFRAWLKEYQKMVQVIDLDFEYRQIGVDDFKSREYGTYLFINFRNIELMQYTGLKDKNGVKIFEGDIVKCGKDIVCEVAWSEYMSKFILINIKDEIECFSLTNNEVNIREVIGNIYENKELLNESN